VFHEAALASVQRSWKILDHPSGQCCRDAPHPYGIQKSRVKRVIMLRPFGLWRYTCPAKHEEMPPTPLSPYALQKYIGEQYCRLFSQLYDLETVSLRYSYLWPKQDPASIYSAVIPRFITALMEGRPPTVYGDGSNHVISPTLRTWWKPTFWPWTSHMGAVNDEYCVGQRTSLNQLLEILRRILRTKLRPFIRIQGRGRETLVGRYWQSCLVPPL